MRASVPYRQRTRRPAPWPAPARQTKVQKQQVPSTHKGSGGRATEKRSASDCAAVLSLEHGKVSSDRRRGVHFYICACAIMQRCPTCFRHLAGTSCGHRLRPPSHAYVFHNSYGHISCHPSLYARSLRQLMLRYRATTYLVLLSTPTDARSSRGLSPSPSPLRVPRFP